MLSTMACGGITQLDFAAAATGGSTGTFGTSTGGTASVGGSATFKPGGAPSWTADHPLCKPSLGDCATALSCDDGCTAADPPVCYKTCGPDKLGFKSEICTGGTYVEQADCSFDPLLDYSCFKLPAVADAICPSTAPRHGNPCTLPPCIVCGGTASGQTTGYVDSKASAKEGYCVCLPATTLSSQKWSCACAGVTWPCPGNLGC